MKTWLLNQWDRLRNSLWLVPAVGLIVALAAAVGSLQLDAAVRLETRPQLEWATTTGPAGRATLSTLAGAIVTVTGVVFSITMLTLAQTSALFGSRLLRSFLNHNVTQFTLAVFLGTSLYCFTVLRTIREVNGGDVFVPHISVGVGLLAGLASLATFVLFIHHVSRAIQAQTVVRNVAHELDEAIDRLFPHQIGEGDDHDDETDSHIPSDAEDEGIVESTSDGYVQAVDGPTLMELATEYDMVIRLLRRPGHFIAAGIPIAVLHPPQPDEGLAERINACFLNGSRRTPRQDVECAIHELVEVAVRALSPGVNDPHTAIACIDYLGAGLMRLSRRSLPSPYRRDGTGRVRVIAEPITFGDALDAAFNEIRQHGCRTASVVIRLAETLLVIARKVTRPDDRDALLRQAAMLERGCEQGLTEKLDQADARRKLQELRELLQAEGRTGDFSKTDHPQALTMNAD